MRVVDGERCALRSCALGGEVEPSTVAARVTTPAKKVRRLSRAAAAACCVEWDAGSQRTHFHLCCWEAVERAASAPCFRPAFAKRARGPRGTVPPRAEQCADDALTLSDAERALVKDVADTCERFDTAQVVQEQARALASLLRASSYAVAFTGAGVSVSAGISDYRGTAGVDTLVLHGNAEAGEAPPAAEAAAVGADDDEFADAVAASASYLRLRPTACHRALAALSRAGLLRFVVTQNCDDLHARAGTPRAQLARNRGLPARWAGASRLRVGAGRLQGLIARRPGGKVCMAAPPGAPAGPRACPELRWARQRAGTAGLGFLGPALLGVSV